MQQPRQMYGLGSFVKKITKGVKKIVKSPIGKAAILGIGAFGLPGGALGMKGFLPQAFKTGASNFLFGGGTKFAPALNFKGAATTKPGIFGLAKNFLGGEKTFGKTAAMFGIGTLGGAGLQALEAAGLDTDNPNAMPRDVEALKAYMRDGYMKLNPDAEPKEVDEFIQSQTYEYRANGGRIGYGDGSDDKSEMSKRIEELMDDGYDFGSAVKKYMEETRDKEAMGGRIGYDIGSSPIRNMAIKMNSGRGPITKKDYIDIYEMAGYDKDVATSLGTKHYKTGRGQDSKTQGLKNGGRIGYAFGNKPEQNAIQAAGIEGLPLNQNPAGVTELDLRDSGGFIPPVGVKEKADDIPAMLANNEFVFTADAVRGMGDGNVNKGAQRMYDMMKKLEKGGRV